MRHYLPMTPTDFITRWQTATGSELANSQLFVTLEALGRVQKTAIGWAG